MTLSPNWTNFSYKKTVTSVWISQLIRSFYACVLLKYCMDLIRNIFNHVKAQSICQENQDKFWQITLHPCWRTKLFKLAASLFLMNRKKNYDFIFNDKIVFASHLVLLSIQNRPDIKSFMKSLPFQIYWRCNFFPECWSCLVSENLFIWKKTM